MESLSTNEWLIFQSQEMLRSTQTNNSSQFGSWTTLTNRSNGEALGSREGYKYHVVFQHLAQFETHQLTIRSSQHYPFQTTPNLNTTKPNQHNQHFKMQFSTLAIAAFAALTSAAALKRAPADLCPALDTPQCCQLDVDGVADLTCSARKP
jgi:hypothetical protein